MSRPAGPRTSFRLVGLGCLACNRSRCRRFTTTILCRMAGTSNAAVFSIAAMDRGDRQLSLRPWVFWIFSHNNGPRCVQVVGLRFPTSSPFATMKNGPPGSKPRRASRRYIRTDKDPMHGCDSKRAARFFPKQWACQAPRWCAREEFWNFFQTGVDGRCAAGTNWGIANGARGLYRPRHLSFRNRVQDCEPHARTHPELVLLANRLLWAIVSPLDSAVESAISAWIPPRRFRAITVPARMARGGPMNR
jgi:hypothetical protein